jgi:hypothetical protein
MFGPKPYTGIRHEDDPSDDDLKKHVQPIRVDAAEKAAETEEPQDSQ